MYYQWWLPRDTRRSEVPLATSFNPTFSMALSRARPIRNSKERSGDISTLDLAFLDSWHTVYALLVSERLSLLSLVPFDHKSIAERQSGAGVCSSKILYQSAIR